MKIKKSKINDYANITVENDSGMELALCTLGAAIRDIKVPDKNGESVSVTLCPASEETFRASYYGKTIGRTAGRIKDATFSIDAKTATLEKNNHGQDNLHGGKTGFHSKIFDCETCDCGEYVDAVFKCFSPDGEGGYFGNVNVTVTYRVWKKENKFRILYDATSDTKTLLNLTNHVYLNMSGNLREKASEHTLFINAPKVAKLNERLIIEDIIPVSREMDFTAPHAIGDYIESEEAQRYTRGYDHPYFLAESGMDKRACALYSRHSKIALEMFTTYPCAVFYANSCPHEGMELVGGKQDEKYLAACLECEYHPDGIHNGAADCGITSPENPYHAEVEYRFSVR